MSDIKIIDHGYMDSKHDLSIEFYKNPNALVIKRTQKGTLFANVCGQCGYVELAVGNPEELWNLYNENRTA
jgi:hypothetical protein